MRPVPDCRTDRYLREISTSLVYGCSFIYAEESRLCPDFEWSTDNLGSVLKIFDIMNSPNGGR